MTTVTTNNDTATGLTWNVAGIAEPGDLTAVPNVALANGFSQFEQNGLFDVAAGMNAFVPDLNIHNEGSYDVDIPVEVTAPEGITLESLSLTGIIANNVDVLQGAGRELDLGGAILPSGTANRLRISIGAGGSLVGHNAGFDDLQNWIELDDEVDSDGETTDHTRINVTGDAPRYYRVILQ